MRRHTKRTDGPPSCCSLSQSKPRSKVVHCMSMDLQLWHTPQHCLVWVNLAWSHNATLAGVLISLDRQERGRADISAIQEVERDYHCKVISIITLADLIEYLEEKAEMADNLAAVRAYQQTYGV